MPERLVIEERQLTDGNLQTPINIFRAASGATGTVLSAHTGLASGALILVSNAASNQIRMRLLNAQINNNDANWISIEFRDGNVVGPRLYGPQKVNPYDSLLLGQDQLIGRAALSSIVCVAVSGGVASGVNPVSNGLIVHVSFVPEHLDYNE